MKGIVFTEFIEHVESSFGFGIANDMIENSSALSTNGVYSSVGNYPHQDLFSMIQELSARTGKSEELLLNEYGQHLFSQFAKLYPIFFEKINSSFSFLSIVESHIHKEVLKLYPDAELPTFHSIKITDNQMEMTYRSNRKMHEFAYGLILGCLEFFGEEGMIQMNHLSNGEVHFQINLLEHE